jgi:hypothetical protein
MTGLGKRSYAMAEKRANWVLGGEGPEINSTGWERVEIVAGATRFGPKASSAGDYGIWTSAPQLSARDKARRKRKAA